MSEIIKNAEHPKQRESNIELLRIISMLMIVSVHYFPNGILDPNLVESGSGQYYLGWLLETLCIIGPNAFTMIAAWFLCTREESDIRKAILLYVKMVVYDLVLFIPGIFLNNVQITGHNIVLLFFPFLDGRHWYIETYIILLLFYPFINFLINNISQKAYQILICIWISIFSIWFTFFSSAPIQDWGYGITTFVTCYLIVGYIKLYGFSNRIISCLVESKVYLFSMYMLTSCISFLLVTGKIGGVLEFFFPNNIAHAYCSFWVIISALSVFLLFKKFRMKSNRIINRLASLTMGISIVHANYSCQDLIYHKLLHAERYANSKWFVLIYLFQVSLQFLVSGIIVALVDIPLNKIWNKLSFKGMRISCKAL